MSVVESSDYHYHKGVEILWYAFNNSLEINTCFHLPVISLTSFIQRSEFTEAPTAGSVPSWFLKQCRHEAEWCWKFSSPFLLHQPGMVDLQTAKSIHVAF